MAFEKACNTGDIAENGVIRCKVGGKTVAVFRLQDGYYATSARCPCRIPTKRSVNQTTAVSR